MPARWHQVDLLFVFGFSRNPTTRPVSSIRMMPKPAAVLPSTGIAAIVTSAGTLDATRIMAPEIHAIELIARQNQHQIDARLLDVAQVLPHGVGRSLVPAFVPSMVCWAASISTNPPLNTSKLYVLAMCRCRLTELNCV